jgi:hypothetical protein
MPTGNQKTWAIAAFVLLLTVFCSAFWLSDSSVPVLTPPTHQERQSEASREYNQEKPEKSWWQRFTNDPIAVFTAVLTVFTGILAGTTWNLVRSAEDTAERQLRAYLHVRTRKKRDIEIAIGNRVFVEISVRNSGLTPAHDVLMQSNIACAPYPEPGELPPLLLPEESSAEGSQAPIHSKQRVYTTIGSRHVFSTIDDQNIRFHGWRIYAYGKIFYLDAFDRPRTTEFRFCTAMDETGNVSLSYCLGGNKAN